MYGDGTIWYDKARKKYCYDYYDNDGKRHRKRFATEKEAKGYQFLVILIYLIRLETKHTYDN